MKTIQFPLNERLAPADQARLRHLAATRGLTCHELLETALKQALHTTSAATTGDPVVSAQEGGAR